MAEVAQPAGEVIWTERGDEVVLTADGWLVYVGVGERSIYGWRLRATPELVAMLRGRR